MKTLKFVFMGFSLSLYSSSFAQHKAEIGFAGSVARFYPQTEFFSQSLNNQVDNGFGWSAGIYYEKQWTSRIKPLVELNYSNSSSDFYLETSSYNSGTGEYQQPKSDVFRNEPFRYMSVSVGSKFFLNKSLFIYPAVELAKSLNRKVDLWSISYYSKDWDFVYLKDRYISKTNYYAKLGVGVDLKMANIILEYVYGLNYQLSFFEYSNPFGVNNRNKYLQLKIQVPVYKFK